MLGPVLSVAVFVGGIFGGLATGSEALYMAGVFGWLAPLAVSSMREDF